MDSDCIYTTNQKEIVEHAKYCYKNFPTIVNNIPKEKNNYNNTLLDFAVVDNKLAAANMAIGESSNLAQIALSYTYNFDEQVYKDAVCILSVLAQCAIDNAKRSYDIDLVKEIGRLKGKIDIRLNGIPLFFDEIKKKNARKAFNLNPLEEVSSKIPVNKDLVCPMNYLRDVKFKKFKSKDAALPINHFFINKTHEAPRKKSKKVEELIEKYSLKIFDFNKGGEDEELLLREDFDELIEDIKAINISKSYAGVMSYLLNRGLRISPSMNNKREIKSKLNKNRSLLVKVLYEVNKEVFLSLFTKNIYEKANESAKNGTI